MLSLSDGTPQDKSDSAVYRQPIIGELMVIVSLFGQDSLDPFRFSVIVSVFDTSDLTSLDKSVQWMEEASTFSDRALKFLVGNKVDLIHGDDLAVMETDLEKLCDNIGAELWCVSAKSG